MDPEFKSLYDKLEALLRNQEKFRQQIAQLRNEIQLLENRKSQKNVDPFQSYEIKKIEKDFVGIKETVTDTETPYSKSREKKPGSKSDLEKFIGENLINKIGIVILVIGVAIGAKYAIDHDLINPLTRIILGYLVGAGLMFFAMKLKKNYENFSAVLLSGSMAIMYFITFAAYSFYGLFPQTLAFVIMVLFTGFTVMAAIKYDRQVIALIGLVGAYAVPFLLSDGSGRVVILFSYITIVNAGILFISFRKEWKAVYYSSFGLTWLIFLSWVMIDYSYTYHFNLAFTFLSIFFITFYIIFLAYKIFRNEIFRIKDIVYLQLNSFLFYGLGYYILDTSRLDQYLGIFTLVNAVIHFGVGFYVFRQKLADKNLQYLITGLVLVFLSITFPVQLDGDAVTLLWAGEAVLLFWIGRTKKVLFYEKLSYPLIVIAVLSLMHDWQSSYDFTYYKPDGFAALTPLFNIQFLSSLLVVAAISFIAFINFRYQQVSKFRPELLNVLIPGILVGLLYFTFRLEVDHYWLQQFYIDGIFTKEASGYEYMKYNPDLKKFRAVWLINYSLIFFSLIAFVNVRKIKNVMLGKITLGFLTLFLATFLIQGLYDISELRDSYLKQLHYPYFVSGVSNIYFRYLSILIAAIAVLAWRVQSRHESLKLNLAVPFDFVLHVTIVWIISSELIHWLDMSGSSENYKIGLSILWGTYSLLLIILGISKKKKHLRIAAIALFSITLLKLFFYDIAHLNTISKTIVFIVLGVLLLTISFLYNKYKHAISND